MDEFQGSNSDASEQRVFNLSDNLAEIIETDPLINNPTSNYRYDDAPPPAKKKLMNIKKRAKKK